MVRRLMLGFFLLSLTVLGYAEQPSVKSILAKVSDTYHNLQSYKFVMEVSSDVEPTGPMNPRGGSALSNFHKSTTSEVTLAESASGMFRLEVKSDSGSTLLMSDGATEWLYLPKKNQYTEQAGSAHTARPLLNFYRYRAVDRIRAISQYSSFATLSKDKQLKIAGNKIGCYDVEIQTPQDGEIELWVDKGSYIVWRVKYSPAAPNGVAQPTVSLDEPKGNTVVGKLGLEPVSLQTTVTINLKEAKVNTPLEESLFEFNPPKGAVKISPADRATR